MVPPLSHVQETDTKTDTATKKPTPQAHRKLQQETVIETGKLLGQKAYKRKITTSGDK